MSPYVPCGPCFPWSPNAPFGPLSPCGPWGLISPSGPLFPFHAHTPYLACKASQFSNTVYIAVEVTAVIRQA